MEKRKFYMSALLCSDNFLHRQARTIETKTKIPLRNQGDYFLTLKTTNMKSVEYSNYASWCLLVCCFVIIIC